MLRAPPGTHFWCLPDAPSAEFHFGLPFSHLFGVILGSKIYLKCVRGVQNRGFTIFGNVWMGVIFGILFWKLLGASARGLRISGFPWGSPGLTLGRPGTSFAPLSTFWEALLRQPFTPMEPLGLPRGPKGRFSSISVPPLMISTACH